MERQPLQPTIPISRRRRMTSRLDIAGQKSRSKILMANNNNKTAQQQAQHQSQAYSLVAADLERENRQHQPNAANKKNNNNNVGNNKRRWSRRRSQSMKRLLVGVMDRFPFRRNSSTSSSSRQSTSHRSLTISSSWPPEPRLSDLLFEKHRHDGSLTTVLSTDTEPCTPILDHYYMEPDTSAELDFDVALETDSTEQECLDSLHSQQIPMAAATLLQTLVRGYLQRYAFRILILRRKLVVIEKTKQKQLSKLMERSKIAKKREKSIFEFRTESLSRRLQRTTRIIPHLFREAQRKLQENIALVHQLQQKRLLHYTTQLDSSHRNLQVIAHAYLEFMEDIPGMWEAVQAHPQWMGPKKPRARRGFGPDGKIIKLPSSKNISNTNVVEQAKKKKKEYNTRDDDLPTPSSVDDDCADKRSFHRQDSDHDDSTTDEVAQYLQTYFELDESQDIDGAIQQVQGLANETMLN